MRGHPFLQPVQPTAAESISDADPIRAGAIQMSDGTVRYIAPGSLPDQLGLRTELHVPLTKAKSETTASHSNIRNFGSYGAGNEPGLHNHPGV